MKDYVKYMDTVTVDAAARGRILQRLSQTKPQNRVDRVLVRYAGLAACAVALLFGIWLIPGLLADPIGLTRPGQTHPSDPSSMVTPAPVNWDPGNQIFPNDPSRPAIDTHALVLNTGGNMMSGSQRLFDPSLRFYNVLTQEQIDAVFPELYMSLNAHAWYLHDGTLTWATAYIGDHKFMVHATEGVLPRDGLILYETPPAVSMVHGVEVTASYTPNYHEAEFMLGGIAYLVCAFDGGELAAELMTEVVNRLILGGPGDLGVLADPVVPELRDDVFTLDEAYGDPDFGAYLPLQSQMPPRFAFESAHRFINQSENGLLVLWSETPPLRSFDSIRWMASKVTDWHLERLVSPEEREKYDLSLYAVPWTETMPAEIRQIAMNPVFRIEELTLDMIRTRIRFDDRAGRIPPGYSGQLLVLYGGTVVDIHVVNVTPEQLWEMLPRK